MPDAVTLSESARSLLRLHVERQGDVAQNAVEIFFVEFGGKRQLNPIVHDRYLSRFDRTMVASQSVFVEPSLAKRRFFSQLGGGSSEHVNPIEQLPS